MSKIIGIDLGTTNSAAAVYHNDEIKVIKSSDNKMSDSVEKMFPSIVYINKKLDPNLHQAMMEIEDDQKEPGTIVQEVQKGFMIKDRLLRPSLVGVSKNTEIKDDKSEENKENLDK